MNRRNFMGAVTAAAGAGALGGATLAPQAQAAVSYADQPMFKGFGAPFRAECDIRDCEVDGEIPAELDGTFYRVGPDFQYPPRLPNIPFDGEGHVGMFRFEQGHVDFRSRFVRTQRYKA